MSNFLKYDCPNCGQPIEYPSEGTGQAVPCPTCEKLVVLMPASSPTTFGSIVIPPIPAQEKAKRQKQVRTNLPTLTEETVRAKTKKGDAPLHRAAKIGRIYEIPRHLLRLEMFMERNANNETPIYIAAEYGHLNQVPSEFLTRETLTVLCRYGRTPLHQAAIMGHIDQIPAEFLTIEFLSLPIVNTTYTGETCVEDTVAHLLAQQNQLSKLPANCLTPEIWELKDQRYRTTVREAFENRNEHDAQLAAVRSQPATEKQKEKLRYFGCTWDEGITKGQASDALDKCARDFPDVNRAYYERPATEGQLAYLRPILESEGVEPDDYAEPGKPLSYGRAKDLIRDCEMEQRENEREEEIAYMHSDESRIDEAWMRIDEFRSVTREQVAQAWALAKSRKTNETRLPNLDEVTETLKELFPE